MPPSHTVVAFAAAETDARYARLLKPRFNVHRVVPDRHPRVASRWTRAAGYFVGSTKVQMAKAWRRLHRLPYVEQSFSGSFLPR